MNETNSEGGASRRDVRQTDAPAVRPYQTIYALSVKQPWAWLIVNGYKPIENRDWKSNYRGPLLIHATDSGGMSEYNACKLFIDDFTSIELPPFEKLQRGGIIGAVRMDDCLSNPCEFTHEQHPWFVGLYGFVLSHPQKCDYLPIPGKLGIWPIPPLAVPKGFELMVA